MTSSPPLLTSLVTIQDRKLKLLESRLSEPSKKLAGVRSPEIIPFSNIDDDVHCSFHSGTKSTLIEDVNIHSTSILKASSNIGDDLVQETITQDNSLVGPAVDNLVVGIMNNSDQIDLVNNDNDKKTIDLASSVDPNTENSEVCYVILDDVEDSKGSRSNDSSFSKSSAVRHKSPTSRNLGGKDQQGKENEKTNKRLSSVPANSEKSPKLSKTEENNMQTNESINLNHGKIRILDVILFILYIRHDYYE